MKGLFSINMLVLSAILLALLPTIAILYPLIRRSITKNAVEDESSPRAELERRWEISINGLKNTEQDRLLGNISDQDYAWLRKQYLDSASLVMKTLEDEESREQKLLTWLEFQSRSATPKTHLNTDCEEKNVE